MTMRLDTNASIQVLESELSNVQITETIMLEGISLAVAIAIVAFIGLVIRGLFIFYIKYKAPKLRPINKLMLDDQVYLNPKHMTPISKIAAFLNRSANS